jgi:hypothetical protein
LLQVLCFIKQINFILQKIYLKPLNFKLFHLYQKFLCLKTKAKSFFYFHHIRPLIGELPATAYTLTSSSVNLFDSKVTPPSKTLTV